MKQAIVISNLSSLLLILLSFNFFDAALRFLVVGELPFFEHNVSPEGMVFVLLVLAASLVLAAIPRHLSKKALTDLREQANRLPKRRYTRV